MKACEKRIMTSGNDEFDELWDGPPNAPAFYRLGCKQALEWVLEQEYNYDKPDVYDTIRKELEAK